MDKRAFFVDNLNILVKSEYEELFRILKKNGGDWSENCNGILFDVNGLSNEIFEKLYGFLQYCIKQREDEATRLESMNELKKDIKEELKTEAQSNNKDFVITL